VYHGHVWRRLPHLGGLTRKRNKRGPGEPERLWRNSREACRAWRRVGESVELGKWPLEGSNLGPCETLLSGGVESSQVLAYHPVQGVEFGLPARIDWTADAGCERAAASTEGSCRSAGHGSCVCACVRLRGLRTDSPPYTPRAFRARPGPARNFRVAVPGAIRVTRLAC